MESQIILKRLAENNLFLFSNGNKEMCLKDENNNIVISFPLIPKSDILTSLKKRLNELSIILEINAKT